LVAGMKAEAEAKQAAMQKAVFIVIHSIDCEHNNSPPTAYKQPTRYSILLQ
jgi:hypothetical protein